MMLNMIYSKVYNPGELRNEEQVLQNIFQGKQNKEETNDTSLSPDNDNKKINILIGLSFRG